MTLPRREWGTRTPKRGRRTEPRSLVLSGRELRRASREAGVSRAELGRAAAERPRTRGDCKGGERPCPWVSCRHHLYLDVTRVGTVKLNHPRLELEQLVETCALDVADRGEATLDAIGKLLNLTRERARQIEGKILDRLRRSELGEVE